MKEGQQVDDGEATTGALLGGLTKLFLQDWGIRHGAARAVDKKRPMSMPAAFFGDGGLGRLTQALQEVFELTFRTLFHSAGSILAEQPDMDDVMGSNSLFPRPFSLITTSCNLEGPFLTLASEAQGFGFPAGRAANDNPASRFQGVETMADIALIALEGAHQFLVAARDPPLRPLVVGGQPVQNMLVQL